MNAPPGQPPGGWPPGPPQQQYAPQQVQPQAAQPGPMAPQQQYAPQQVQPQAAQPAPMVPQQPYVPQAVQQPYGYAPAPVQKKNETLGIVSVGLAAAAWLMQFHLLMSIPAVIVGFMALRKIKADPDGYGGGGMAKAGIGIGLANVVLSLFGLLLGLIWVVFVVIMEAM